MKIEFVCRGFKRFTEQLSTLITQGIQIMATAAETRAIVEELRTEIAAQTTELDSLNAFVEGLFEQIKVIVDKPDVPDEVKADLEQLRAGLQGNKQRIADAFTANTPAEIPPADPIP